MADGKKEKREKEKNPTKLVDDQKKRVIPRSERNPGAR
jgi:hypothetical protein